MKTNQATINAILWKACDTFRGTINSDQYKDYILTMLFVKYLSDYYKEKLEEYKEKYGDKEDRIQKSLSREKFILDESCTFEYIYKNRNAENLGEIINSALERIEEDNKAKLEGVFRNIDFNSEAMLGKTKERNALLKHLLDDFNDPKLDLRPSKLAGNDVIGDSYEYMIAYFASDAGKKGGEFFTPSQVSRLVAKLVSPKSGNRIYDPTCGSGSLLIKASKEVPDNNFQIYGQEKNGQTYALCRMNMFLHEIDDAKIEWGDTIRNPLHLENDSLMKFDVVVANPPFSLDKWGDDYAENDPYKRFGYGIPPKSKGDYAFVEHMVYSANENGTVGVVLPHGVLFRGASEGKIREGLINDNYLDAVIGLPQNLFFGTGIPACILVFKKNKITNDVIFIDASKEFESGKNQNVLRDLDIEKIVETYKNRQDIEKYSHVASLEEIRENDYNLNIPRYVDTFEEEEPVDLNQVKTDISKIEGELKDIQKEMDKYLDELGL
ncbi:type I restriction-modification system, M subunit [Methanococcus maripaludis C5]|uniref:site-specific DNA-methyltransferase (adenine-specific) n=1 Tax=Methanococcus maripaludis (strain C5 / ATCC BAA-1333) TaxID=402880 RepID=A4FXJ2_METM5|nr:type I restriction-modification system subunit M [Methanococcus maripaludis]ABO34926.1 type I restriction-modification system, M subunit [Methanococcus maripaludis C5]